MSEWDQLNEHKITKITTELPENYARKSQQFADLTINRDKISIK